MVSGAKPALDQNANPLAKPGRMPPLRSSTVLAQVCPVGVSDTFAGLPETKPVPSFGQLGQHLRVVRRRVRLAGLERHRELDRRPGQRGRGHVRVGEVVEQLLVAEHAAGRHRADEVAAEVLDLDCGDVPAHRDAGHVDAARGARPCRRTGRSARASRARPDRRRSRWSSSRTRPRRTRARRGRSAAASRRPTPWCRCRGSRARTAPAGRSSAASAPRSGTARRPRIPVNVREIGCPAALVCGTNRAPVYAAPLNTQRGSATE